MATSQYSVFSSNDAAGPGLLSATNGGLITVLTACLVTGYSGVTAVNWTNPIATASNMASYKPPLGSQKILVVGDDGTAATIGNARGAYFTGWRTLAGIATPVGSGTGQYPTPAQFGTVGAVGVFKSDTVSTTRPWTLFADGYGFLLFIDYIGSGATIVGHAFGDIYSYSPNTDDNRSLLIGNLTSSTSVSAIRSDRIAFSGVLSAAWTNGTGTFDGWYMAGPTGSGGTSVRVLSVGDSFGMINNTGAAVGSFQGTVPLGPNNSQMLAPIRIISETGQLRGRVRGLYHSLHLPSNYSQGMPITGGGDYAGRTFMAIGPGGYNPSNGAGFWIVETSATIENN